MKRLIDQTSYVLHTIIGRKTPYIGWLGEENLGDEILFEAHTLLFSNLRLQPYNESTILSLYSKFIDQRLYKQAVLGGGTLIYQSDFWLQKVSYFLEKKVPMFCFGTGVGSGEFLKKTTGYWRDQRKEWNKALEQFTFVGVRGPLSQSMLEKSGFKKAIITGDTALALTPDFFKKPGKGIIGLNYGISEIQSIWGDKKKYTSEIISTINQLIKDGYTVHLLPIFSKDVKSNQALMEKVSNNKLKLILKYSSFNEYVNEIQKCEFVIAQKLHASVIATMHRLPTITLEYNPKCADYMESVKMHNYIIKTSDVTEKKLIEKCHDIQKNKTSIINTLDKEVSRYKKIQITYAKEIKNNYA